MACLLYCVTQSAAGVVPSIIGVAEQPVRRYDAAGLGVYWSELSGPDAIRGEGPGRRVAEQRYQQVLRAIVAEITPIPFPFPAVVPDLEALDGVVTAELSHLEEALTRLSDTVQYDLTATWEEEAQQDLSAPVSGKEYVKRRQEAEARVGAIDAKLRSVTAECVREWRSPKDFRKHVWRALVPRSDRERFIAALRSAGPSQGVKLRLSGPWPPSEFVMPKEKAQ
jgi:hypothetical protein